LHGAPGGQTGANIDDCIDDVPRLFIDEDKWHKGIALWEKLAKIYSSNATIGGYDLLNEPIRPAHGTLKNYDYLLPKLEAFYDEAIAAIRKHDKNHMISLEGHHWAQDLSVFNKKYDDNMIIHFHRYAVLPERASLDKYLAASEKWDVPLWLGETGENKITWFAAYYQTALNFGIGYNLWPYKKMGKHNCPITIKTPKNWDSIIKYSKGDKHPGYEKASEILNEFLENLKFKNCILNQDTTNHVFRKVPFSLRATDFDENPNRNDLYKGSSKKNNVFQYRNNTGLTIIEEYLPKEKEFHFDTQWDRFLLVLNKGEFVTYSANELVDGSFLYLDCADTNAVLRISQNVNGLIETTELEVTEGGVKLPLNGKGYAEIKIECVAGVVCLRSVTFDV